MSEHGIDPAHGHGHGGSQEPEGVDMGRSMAILVGSLLAFAAVVVWATVIMNSNVHAVLPNGWPEAPPEVGMAEIGIVNQKMFEVDRRMERRAVQVREELNSYGWVDPQKHVVHVPIEKAIESLLAEQPK
jgi:hypothetical protein